MHLCAETTVRVPRNFIADIEAKSGFEQCCTSLLREKSGLHGADERGLRTTRRLKD